MNITKGRKFCARKIVIYGPAGIGKSTLASKFPDAVFIDTEDSTSNMDVSRFDKPSSWQMLLQEVQYVIDNPNCCKTLVIDTVDWAEQLEIIDLCNKKGWTGLEDPGYGKGYQYSAEEFGKLLNKLSEVITKNINVVLVAHSQLRKIELPDEMGAYDHWEMKTSKKVAPLIKEWCDALFFCNYKTFVIKTDSGSHKAQGGKRVMYTSHHPCWDAKNRDGLSDELPMDYESIRHIIENSTGIDLASTYLPEPEPEPKPAPAPKQKKTGKKKAKEPDPVPDLPEEVSIDEELPKDLEVSRADLPLPEGIPKALADLMRENRVSEWDIQAVCAQRGYYPEDTPIANYDPDFINGCLVAAWPQVFQMIQDRKAEFNKDNPFLSEGE